jgi:hypothetical protein
MKPIYTSGAPACTRNTGSHPPFAAQCRSATTSSTRRPQDIENLGDHLSLRFYDLYLAFILIFHRNPSHPRQTNCNERQPEQARTESPPEAEAAGRDQLLIDDAELQTRLGQKYCDEDELLPLLLAQGFVKLQSDDKQKLVVSDFELKTRLGQEFCDDTELLPLLLTKGWVVHVRTIRIEVHPLGGDSINVTLNAARPTVGETKTEVARVQGTEQARQELYVVAPLLPGGGAVREDNVEPELLDKDELELHDGMVLTMAVKDDDMKGWTAWKEKGSGRSRTFNIPEIDYEADECIESLPFAENSIGDVTYTIVGCGYSGRIRITHVPNAFWETDADQRTSGAAKHIAILKAAGVSEPYAAFAYHGLAGQAYLDQLMSFGHCGCFQHGTLYKVELIEAVVKGKTVRILLLDYDTESG